MNKINILLLLIWCIVIFIFSHQDAENSSNTSYEFADNVVNLVEDVIDKDIDNDVVIPETMNYIRKTAHLFIYFILGLLSINAFKHYNIKNVILTSLLFCFIYACSDEVHQLFIVGRSGQVVDVCIDFIGSSIGIFLYYKILKKTL